MFWGLVIEPGKKYSQTVEDSFHVSKAALDLLKASDELTTLILDYEGQQEYILCHLDKANKQESLDLNFQAGDTISMFTQGQSSIHLSGYLLGDDDDEDMTLGEMMEEEEEEEEEEEAEAVMEEVAKVAKKPLNNNGTAQKRKKAEVEEEEAEGEDGEEEEEPVKPQKQKKQEQKQKGKPQGQQQQPKQQQQQNKAKQGGEKQQGQAAGNGQADAKEGPKKEQAKRTLQGGLVVEDVKPGSGQEAKKGDRVSVYYVGRLQKGNKKFDSSTQGPGFKFRLGAGEVIKGWDFGIAGMKVGGKRKLTIPAKLAYGAGGSPPIIPPNATLVFDVELKALN